MPPDPNIPVYSPREALERCRSGSVLLDLRPEAISLFKAFDVPDMLICPWNDLAGHLEHLPADREIILADSTGVHVRKSAADLMDAGFEKVAILAGGMVEWERDALPVSIDLHARLSGSCMCQIKYRNPK